MDHVVDAVVNVAALVAAVDDVVVDMDSKRDTSDTRQTKNDRAYDKEFPPLGTQRQDGKAPAPKKSLPDKPEPPLSQKMLKALSKSMRGRPEGPEVPYEIVEPQFPTMGATHQAKASLAKTNQGKQQIRRESGHDQGQ
ncbi:hypothetical protein BHE90_012953 [Fusarium euwallaceae]|uniref:Uncharacterized protein n=1 Tax=Fusarium euwallaceae TaxID=1147111 RepID=A0A430LA98_9HYPO|nr:hypothetical protein BHE90_012953 [Fusarium euwallaceae]